MRSCLRIARPWSRRRRSIAPRAGRALETVTGRPSRSCVALGRIPSRATSSSIQSRLPAVSVAMSLPSGEIGGPIDSVIVPGPLAEQSLRPQVAGVVRDRQDRRRQARSRAARRRSCSFARVPAADARALGIDDDPEALREALAALLRDLLHRVRAGLAVDRDRRGEREAPAEERDRQQLLLGDERERREVEVERERLPRRAVLATSRCAASAGMFSAPITRQRMPQIQRAPHRLTRHQLAAMLVARHARQPRTAAREARRAA